MLDVELYITACYPSSYIICVCVCTRTYAHTCAHTCMHMLWCTHVFKKCRCYIYIQTIVADAVHGSEMWCLTLR
jgi:hypothetical protein